MINCLDEVSLYEVLGFSFEDTTILKTSGWNCPIVIFSLPWIASFVSSASLKYPFISKTSLYSGDGFNSKNLISLCFISTLKSTIIELFDVVTDFIECKTWLFVFCVVFCVLFSWDTLGCGLLFCWVCIWLFVIVFAAFWISFIKIWSFFSSADVSFFSFLPSCITFFKSSIFCLSSFRKEDFKNSILASLYCSSILEAKEKLRSRVKIIKNLVKMTTLP